VDAESHTAREHGQRGVETESSRCSRRKKEGSKKKIKHLRPTEENTCTETRISTKGELLIRRGERRMLLLKGSRLRKTRLAGVHERPSLKKKREWVTCGRADFLQGFRSEEHDGGTRGEKEKKKRDFIDEESDKCFLPGKAYKPAPKRGCRHKTGVASGTAD